MNQNQLTRSQKRICDSIKHKKVYVDVKQFSATDTEFGLYANKDIKAGETIFIAKGKVVRVDIKSSSDSATYPNAIGIKKMKWLDPDKTNPLVYLNHSCNPNTGIKGSVTFKALSKIKKGSEITMDYSITEIDTLWTLDNEINCLCHSTNCRKIIRSIQHLPVTIYKRYLPFVPTIMQREYTKVHPNFSS